MYIAFTTWGEENPTVGAGRIFPLERFGSPHHFICRHAPETMERCSVTSPFLCLHLCLEGICFPSSSPSLWSLLRMLQEQRIYCLPALQCIWAGMEDRGLSLLSSPLVQLRHFWSSYTRLLAAFCRIFTSVCTGFWPHTCK